MKRLFLMFLCLSIFSSALAQEGGESVPFNGLISQASGAKVNKIKVEVKSTGKYTYTDKLGRFGLTNVKPDDILILKGRNLSVEVAVGGRKRMKIMLQDNLISQTEESEELIETGYGYIKKREVTNSNTGSISGEELRRTGVQNLERALLGRVPGLAMIDGELTIRGKNSINSSTKLLYLVDNQPVESLSFVNISDVESVTVFKDGTMYGIRGANGVILVKTISAKR